MLRSLIVIPFLNILLSFLPASAAGLVITADATWSGEVLVEEDVFIPKGVTLTISPATIVRIRPAEGTKTDPEFMSPMTEIMIRGRLVADGTAGAPVRFVPSAEGKSVWAGLIIDGGEADLRSSTVRGAETGISVLNGSLDVSNSSILENHYGLTASGSGAAVRLTKTEVKANDYGVFLFNGAKVIEQDAVIAENRKKDRYEAEAKQVSSPLKGYAAAASAVHRVYGDEALLGETVWQNRIEVNGVIRLPENSRLIILPGTVVEFRRRDTNADGIGENGLLIQGTIIAKGTKERPIIFRSAERERRMADWDAINIMNSDRAQNLIEFCQIEDAYRGLHFHFANVAVIDSVLRNNYRGIQFQESIVEIRGTALYRNKSGIQARDSEISFIGNTVSRNIVGMNILRNTITLRDNLFSNNAEEGLRSREGLPLFERNRVVGNRNGVMVTDGLYGTYSGNVISQNLEAGIALKGTDAIEISGNVIQKNGLNGLNLQDSAAIVRGNLISNNGERGIGVLSFQGMIIQNALAANGLYNLGIDAEGDVAAPMNWWGGEDLATMIFDKADDPARGRADIQPVRDEPIEFSWPSETIDADAVWHGDIVVEKGLSVIPGTELVLNPGTRVLFAKGTGMNVKGRIIAKGTKEKRILFSSLHAKGPAAWDEVLLDHAEGSAFSSCGFEYGTWALHVHFTKLTIEDCSFVENQGGLRFTSGPVEVKDSFFGGNDVGIRSFRGTAHIHRNIIAGNGVGIFVREKGSGLTIRENSFSDNSEYHIRIGDFNDEDVDARENWWDGRNPADSLYDDRSEPGIGSVIYEPYAKVPFGLEAASGARDASRTGSVKPMQDRGGQ